MQKNTLQEVKTELQAQPSTYPLQDLEEMEAKFDEIQNGVEIEVARLKYCVYEKRVSGLLDKAEKKLISFRERLFNGEDGKIVLSKLKVRDLFSQMK